MSACALWTGKVVPKNGINNSYNCFRVLKWDAGNCSVLIVYSREKEIEYWRHHSQKCCRELHIPATHTHTRQLCNDLDLIYA